MKWQIVSGKKISGKTVFLRVDFNVAQNGGFSEDDFRIKAAAPTVALLRRNKCRIVLASHWGRPKGVNPRLSFRRLLPAIKKTFGGRVKFSARVFGESVRKEIKNLKAGEILVLENLRFYPAEEKGDVKFAKNLAALADFFVNDAFGAVHRSHSSIVALPKFLPSAAGLLLAKETSYLAKVFERPLRPLLFVMGGAKASDKLELLRRIAKEADYLILGGVLANTLLKARGFSVGRSRFEKSAMANLRNLKFKKGQLFLPEDSVVLTKEKIAAPKFIGDTAPKDVILDIGPGSLRRFNGVIRSAKTIVWNGPFGLYEDGRFANGTLKLAKSIAQARAFSIVGGGDTVGALGVFKQLKRFDHVSTGGGAMLEFLAGRKLPGLKALGFYE